MIGNSRFKYQVLDNGDHRPGIEVNLAAPVSSVPISSSTASVLNSASAEATNPSLNSDQRADVDKNKITNDSVPNDDYYQDSQDLPTYQDVIYQKQFENPTFTNIRTGDASIQIQSGINNYEAITNYDIGTDCIFITAFVTAFFFNWLGFFACICFMPTVAGKYGALSGFGLSMAKWATIVRYQDWMTNVNDFQQKIFFWIFLVIGFYLFVRGLVTYITIKYNPNSYLRRSSFDWISFR